MAFTIWYLASACSIQSYKSDISCLRSQGQEGPAKQTWNSTKPTAVLSKQEGEVTLKAKRYFTKWSNSHNSHYVKNM